MNNRIFDAAYRDEIDRLRRALVGWLVEQGDEDMMATERAAPEHILLGGRLKLKTRKCGGVL